MNDKFNNIPCVVCGKEKAVNAGACQKCTDTAMAEIECWSAVEHIKGCGKCRYKLIHEQDD